MGDRTGDVPSLKQITKTVYYCYRPTVKEVYSNICLKIHKLKIVIFINTDNFDGLIVGRTTVRPFFFENLFNEPADSRFPKIRIKIKIGFRVFLLEPIRNSSPHFILCDAFANGSQWTWRECQREV